MTEPATPQPSINKPWYMRWWVWLIAAVLVVGGIGYAVGGGTTDEPAAESVSVPNVTGQSGDDAQTALLTLGLVVTFESDSGETVLDPGNWEVVDTDPSAGAAAEAGQSIVVNVTRPDESTATTEPDTGANATADGLEEQFALQACAEAGEELAFPDKLTAHWVTDAITQMLEGEVWQVKIGSDLESDAGAEVRVNLVCTVSGTNDAPVIDKVEIDPA